MIISACSDEISQDLATALAVLEREGIRHVDLRGLWGKSVIEMSDQQADRAQQMLAAGGFTVTALSTPIGKTPITADFAFEQARLTRALELARQLGAPYLRIFSFYATEAEAREQRAEALRRLREMGAMAQPYGVVLAHENEEAGFCFWRPEECQAMHQELPDTIRALFEPCSFSVVNYDPFVDALPLLRPYIAYVHVRDTPRGTNHYTVAGAGDARWHDILSDLKAHNFTGYLTLEPHLGWAEADMTDALRTSNFHRAAQALRDVLATL